MQQVENRNGHVVFRGVRRRKDRVGTGASRRNVADPEPVTTMAHGTEMSAWIHCKRLDDELRDPPATRRFCFPGADRREIPHAGRYTRQAARRGGRVLAQTPVLFGRAGMSPRPPWVKEPGFRFGSSTGVCRQVRAWRIGWPGQQPSPGTATRRGRGKGDRSA